MTNGTVQTPTRGRLKADDSATKWLPLSSLIVDPTVQRPLDEGRAERMADKFDLALLGVVEVSIRPNGAIHVVDGQHRVAAARIFGFSEELIECKVHQGLSIEQEAARFVGLNTFSSPRAFDKFRVRVKALDPIALGVDSVLMQFGWRLQTGSTDGCFTAVQAAERVFCGYGTADKDAGPRNLADALGVITEAWGRKPSAASGHLVAGLGLFFARHGALVDKPALVKRLAQYPGGPDNYLGSARGMRDYRGGTLARCIAELSTDLYNKRRSTGQLESWR